MEMPSWLFEIIIYAVLTAILTGILAPITVKYFSKYLEKREKERQKARQEYQAKKDKLSSNINTCQGLKKAVDDYIKNHVEVYKFELLGLLQQGWTYAPTPELEEKMKLFYKKVKECENWFAVCKRTLKLVLIESMRTYLPKSKDSYLENLFERILIQPIIKEAKISRSWLEIERPDLVEDIQKKIDPSEDINRFFKDMNDNSKSEHSLKMLKKKRKQLIGYSEKFKNMLDTERLRLERELKTLTRKKE